MFSRLALRLGSRSPTSFFGGKGFRNLSDVPPALRKRRAPPPFPKQPELPTVQPKMTPLSFRMYGADARVKVSNKAVVGVAAFLGLLGSVAMCGYDDVPERVTAYFITGDLFWKRIYSSADVDIGFALEHALRVLKFSDKVKIDAVNRPNVLERIIEISTESHRDIDVRHQAVEAIEFCCSIEENLDVIIERGLHLKILSAAFNADSLLLRQVLGRVVCQLSKNEKSHVDFGKHGALTLLHTLNKSQMLGRSGHSRALQRISLTLEKIPKEERFHVLFDNEWNLVEKYAEEYRKAIALPFYKERLYLSETGLLMYFHTGAGGFVWGLIEGYWIGNPQYVKFALRNALISSLVPIFFIGACVTGYSHLRKKSENAFDIFYLNAGTFAVIFPWYYILPKIEVYAPYWIGGHVLGFFSFFCYLVYSRSDVLNGSMLLSRKDKMNRDRQKLLSKEH